MNLREPKADDINIVDRILLVLQDLRVVSNSTRNEAYYEHLKRYRTFTRKKVVHKVK